MCALRFGVLNGKNLSRHVVLVAEEVDHTIHLLVTSTDVTHSHLAGVVAATCALERLKQ